MGISAPHFYYRKIKAAEVCIVLCIKFLNLRADDDLAGAVEQICVKGRRSIQVASELLGRHQSRSGKD